MKKKLSEMTLEELWTLFPIILTDHQPQWKTWYQEQETRLLKILPEQDIVRISHIGSTAIPSIWAKPIIDILVEVTPECDMDAIKRLLQGNGFICMNQAENRISFNMGYTEDGFAEKVFHLHLRRKGDHKELYFRDYLLEHMEAAKEYEALKLRLWKQHEHNRDAYTQAKTDLIACYTALALEQYESRYE